MAAVEAEEPEEDALGAGTELDVGSEEDGDDFLRLDGRWEEDSTEAGCKDIMGVEWECDREDVRFMGTSGEDLGVCCKNEGSRRVCKGVLATTMASPR